MRALLAMEWFKLWRQRRTYYALAALVFIEAVVLLGAYVQGREIIDMVLASLRDTFYFEGNLLNGNLVAYFLLNSFWFHVPLILIIVVSQLVTAEYKDGTMQTVMMQPVRKGHFLLAKYLVGMAFTLLVVALLAVSSFGMAYGIFGTGDLIVYLDGLVFFEHDAALQRLVGAFAVGSLSMVFFSVVSLTVAVALREPVQTWIVSVLFLIACNVLMKIDLPLDWANRFLFFQLNETWQYLFLSEIPYSAIWINLILLMGYTVAAIGIGMVIFQKKEIG